MTSLDSKCASEVSAKMIPMARHRDVVTSQTKTRDRVRDLAEVYTHQREVQAMLDLVSDMFPSEEHPRNIARTFLEPSCGSGNFLVAILERKLAFVTTRVYRSTATFETAVLKALSSIYGIDIDQSNVDACRAFLHAEVAHHVNLQLNTIPVTDGFWSAVDAILTTNVQRADALKDARTIRIVEHHWERRTGYVTRKWSYLEEPEPQLDLFLAGGSGPDHDAQPIHYSQLAANPAPVVPRPVKKEEAS